MAGCIVKTVKPEQCMKMLRAFMCQCAKVFLRKEFLKAVTVNFISAVVVAVILVFEAGGRSAI